MEASIEKILCNLIEGDHQRNQVRDIMKKYLNTPEASQLNWYIGLGSDGIMESIESHIHLKTTKAVDEMYGQ